MGRITLDNDYLVPLRRVITLKLLYDIPLILILVYLSIKQFIIWVFLINFLVLGLILISKGEVEFNLWDKLKLIFRKKK